nr:hypothetical protein [Deltaproteobacteria bacterium]
MLLASIAHHGRPIPLDNPGVSHDSGRWRTRGSLNPFGGMRDLAAQAARWFPEASRAGPPLPDAAPFQHGFAGLVMLADWLGSDRDDARFPFSRSLDEDRVTFARDRAARALRENGVAIGHLARALGGEITYARFSAITAPHDTQRTCSRCRSRTMGRSRSSKRRRARARRASLAHFFRLFQAGAVEGCTSRCRHAPPRRRSTGACTTR